VNLYASYAKLDRRADQLSAAALAARAASYQVFADDQPKARATADTVAAAAGQAASSRDTAYAAYLQFRKGWSGIGWSMLALAIALMAGLAIWAPTGDAAVLFLIEALLMAMALIGIGLGVTGRMFGAAIDDRNRVSLSKLQMLMWTILAVAALTTLLTYWLHHFYVIVPGSLPAKNVIIPGDLLLAMGISATSFVATPLLLSLKSGEEPTDDDKDDLATARGVSDLSNQGKVDSRDDPAEARFSDIFHGDEVGNALSIDVSKVQQIFISLLLIGLYGGAIFSLFTGDMTKVQGLPAMDKTFVELLGISHASYLAYKAAPKTATKPS
jgi:hypothetical protein